MRGHCSLPTYPFERSRYWIDDASRDTSRRLAEESPGSAEAIVPTATSVENIMRAQQMTPTTVPNRADRIRATLTEIFESLSGLSLAESDTSVTFLEMGFDSLFLTQVTQALQSAFGLKITFRQLLDRESTLDALSAFVDAKLPAEAFSAAPASSPAIETACPARMAEVNGLEAQSPAASAFATAPLTPLGSSALESIVREQLQAMSELMSKQLDVLRGAGASVDSRALATPPIVSSQPTSSLAQAPRPDGAASAAIEPPIAKLNAKAKEFKPFGPYKPVQTGPVGELTERQSRYLEALIKRYTARTARSKEFTENYRRVLADPRVAAGFRSQWKEMVYPIVTSRSRGSRLWDLDGNEYIDILNGFGPIMFGHAPKFITDAVERNSRTGSRSAPRHRWRARSPLWFAN